MVKSILYIISGDLTYGIESNRIKRPLAIILAILFVVTMTAAAVRAYLCISSNTLNSHKLTQLYTSTLNDVELMHN